MDFKLYITEDYNKINNDEYLEKYKDYIVRIDTSKSVYELPNIFSLNYFLCEFTSFWYIWKNNLYSDYIGFCHYRRGIDLEKALPLALENDYIKCDNTSWFDGVFFPIIKNTTFYDIFENYLKEYDKRMYDIYINRSANVNGRGMFITKYENFEKMCGFMFGFIDKILEDKPYNTKTFLHIINQQIAYNYNTDHAKSWYTMFDYSDENIYRMFAFILEYMSGLYIEYDLEVNNKKSEFMKFIEL